MSEAMFRDEYQDVGAPAEQLVGTTDLSIDPVKDYLRQIARTPLLSAEKEVELAKRIEAGLFATEKLEVENGDISPELQEELQTLAQEGQEAKDYFLRANLRLVVNQAKHHGNRGLPLLDIIQDGNVGLMRAIEKFDYQKGFKFSTYATWWINQAIQRQLPEQTRMIRLPVHVVENLNKVAKARRGFEREHGKKPSVDELAELTGFVVEQVVDLEDLNRDPVSLNKPLEDEGNTEFGDLIRDDDAPTAEDQVIQAMLRQDIDGSLRELPQRTQAIIKMRYGLEDGVIHTLEDVGKRFGLTRERIRQIENIGIKQLQRSKAARNRLEAYTHD